MDEGSIALPAGFQDRTTNIFIQGVAETSQFNLNIGRDSLADKEDSNQYVSRQISIMQEKLPGYQLKNRQFAALGATNLPGEQIDASYKNGGRMLQQRQAAFALPSGRVLIFSATSCQQFDAKFEQLWAQWLASFVLRA